MTSLASRLWFLYLVRGAAAVVVGLVGVGLAANAWRGVPQRSDFLIFFSAALSWQDGESLFRPYLYAPFLKHIVYLKEAPFFLVHNLNAPVVTFLLIPFSYLDLRTAYYAWIALQYALGLWLCLRVAARTLPPHPLRTPGVILVFSGWFPVFVNLLIGQMGLFLFVFIAAGWLALEQRRDLRAGVLFGLALLLKPFVGLLFVWFLLARRWRLLGAGTLTWLVGMGMAVLVFGVQDHLNWLFVLRDQNHGGQSWNAALDGLILRYFGGGLWPSPLDWPWARWALRSAAWGLSAWALIWLSRRPYAFEAGIALVLPLMLFLSPFGWIYYFPVLLLSAAILLRQGASRGGVALALILGGLPQLLAQGGESLPALSHASYYGNILARGADGQLVMHHDGAWHWFVFGEPYTLALLLFCGLALRRARVAESTKLPAVDLNKQLAVV